jgi:hypothetical protein
MAASGAAVVAGGIHLAQAPGTLASSTLLGGLLVVIGTAQLGFAFAVQRTRSVGVLVAVAVIHLGVIAAYVASRTVDLTFLPVRDDIGHDFHHLPVAGGVGNGSPIFPGSHIQPVGVPDLVCLVAELVVLAMIVGLLGHRPRRLLTNLMLALGVAAFTLRGVGYLS